MLPLNRVYSVCICMNVGCLSVSGVANCWSDFLGLNLMSVHVFKKVLVGRE